MKETYYLNKVELPTIPVPHDCVIKEIQLDGNNLIFVFENDISYHDSIKAFRPDAKSLIIRFHLVDDISLFIREKPNRLFHKPGVYKEIDLTKSNNQLVDLPKKRLEYLYHNVGYCSIIVKLWSSSSIILDMTIDYVEFEWIS